MQFDRGYMSPYMVTDTDKMEAVLDDPYILITDKKITNIQEILPVLEKVVQQGKPLLDHCGRRGRGSTGHPRRQQTARHLQRVAVKAPGFGDRRKAMLEDIAILTGGQVITEELGLDLKTADDQQLGRARQVRVTKENTIIVDGAGDAAKIIEAASTKSVNSLKKRLPNSTRKNCKSAWPNWPAA